MMNMIYVAPLFGAVLNRHLFTERAFLRPPFVRGALVLAAAL